jgi:hypothetical protein
MTTATLTRPDRKPLPPVTGTARVLRPVGDVTPDTGKVLINGKPYYLSVLEGGFRLTGYDPRREEVTVYDLPSDLSSCDCADATYRTRPGGCKHVRALSALKAAGKV